MKKVQNVGAFDVIYDYDTNQFTLVNIEYDLQNNNATIVEKLPLHGSRHIAAQRAVSVIADKIMKLKTKKGDK